MSYELREYFDKSIKPFYQFAAWIWCCHTYL